MRGSEKCQRAPSCEACLGPSQRPPLIVLPPHYNAACDALSKMNETTRRAMMMMIVTMKKNYYSQKRCNSANISSVVYAFLPH